MKQAEAFVAQSEIPSEGPGTLFEGRGDVADALIQSLLEESLALSGQPESMVFLVLGGPRFQLVFSDPAPMPLVNAMIRKLGGGNVRPVRLEDLPLRPLLRIDEVGVSVFSRPVYPEVNPQSASAGEAAAEPSGGAEPEAGGRWPG